MRGILNDKERLVRQCIIMRLREPEALAYCKASGFEMSQGTYWRINGNIRAMMQSRLYEIGKSGFEEQHLERIDQLEMIQQEMWKCYFKERSPSRQAAILRHLAEIQPYLSTYYDTTRAVIALQKETLRGVLSDDDKGNKTDLSFLSGR